MKKFGLENKGKAKGKKKFTAWRFLALVLIFYGLLAIFDFELVRVAALATEKMFLRIIPVLALVLVFMSLVERYLDREKVQKHLGRAASLKSWAYAIGAGILISGPPYVLFPLLSDLKSKGMRDSLIAVLLYNRNIKIPFVPVMIFYFGAAFTLILSFYIVLFSIFSGFLLKGVEERS